jgi:hypothetical protein
MVWPRFRMGQGVARGNPSPIIRLWQHRVALSRKGRGRNNEHRARDGNFLTGAFAGMSGVYCALSLN